MGMGSSKILLGRTLLIVIFVGCALSAALLFYFIPKNSAKSGPTKSNEQEELDPSAEATFGLPVRLKIPGINVDSAVESVGLTPQRTMEMPKDPNNVAWFNLGTRPGEIGSSVITGHYGIWKNGKGSVFDNLHKLRVGDKLYIEDDTGTIISFVVLESRSFDPKADASTVFSSDDGKAHLNLITCEGAWNESKKSYSERLVVFTDIVD